MRKAQVVTALQATGYNIMKTVIYFNREV